MDICDLAPKNCGLKPGNSLLSQHDDTGPILVNDVERVLTNIDADYTAPLSSVPCQHSSTAGPSHWRPGGLRAVPRLTTSPVEAEKDNSKGRRANAYCQFGASNWAGKGVGRRPSSCYPQW